MSDEHDDPDLDEWAEHHGTLLGEHVGQMLVTTSCCEEHEKQAFLSMLTEVFYYGRLVDEARETFDLGALVKQALEDSRVKVEVEKIEEAGDIPTPDILN